MFSRMVPTVAARTSDTHVNIEGHDDCQRAKMAKKSRENGAR
jgi:hypothetical protein